MRTTTAVRLGAAITASALALSLGTGTATAGDTDTKSAHLGMAKPDTGLAKTKLSRAQVTRRTQLGKASASAADEPAITALPVSDLASIRQGHIVLSEPGVFLYEGHPVVTNPENVFDLQTTLTVNGYNKGKRELAFEGAQPPYVDIDTGETLSGLILDSRSAVGTSR